MEDYKTILKELKIDWDQTLDNSFNPLKMALKLSSNSNSYMNFKEMFHRLENSLEKVISSNFQSFNESSHSFNSFKNKNKDIVEIYEKLEDALNNLNENGIFSTNNNGLMLNQNQSILPDLKEIQAKYQICASIAQARNYYKTFLMTEDPNRKSTLITKSLEILSDQQLSSIKGVSEYYKIVLKSRNSFSNNINSKLLDFIIKNKTENFSYFDVLLNLQTIIEFDQFCCDNFTKELTNQFEKIILDCQNIKSNELITELCKSISDCIEYVIQNTSIIIKKVNALFIRTDDKDFFGKKKSDVKFIFDLDECLKSIKSVLEKFINRYSFESNEDEDFDIDLVPDTLNYSEIYDRESSIYMRIENSKKYNEKSINFTLITTVNPETVLIMLKYIKNKEIKAFIHQIIESRFYSEVSVRNKIRQIDDIIQNIDNGNIYSEIGDDLMKILERCIAIEEERRVKSHLKSKLFSSLSQLFDKIFVSKIVKNENFSLFLQKQNSNKSLNPDLYVNSIDTLKTLLTRESIRKSDLLTKAQYASIKCLLDSLVKIESREISFITDLFRLALKRQIIVDFFYYFDLLYRQGNYGYYMKICCDILETGIECEIDFGKDLEDCIEKYCKENVSSINVNTKKDLCGFLDILNIFSEIFDEFVDISKTVNFFNKVNEGKADDKSGRILIQKIS